jgi:hypothetical protein
MQQFVVPQFISEEASILGPIKVRQFVILLVTAGILFIIYRFSDVALFITLAIPIGGFALVLSFFSPNGRPFHFFLLNLLQTLSHPPLRVWKKEVTTAEIKAELDAIDNVDLHQTTVVERQKPTSSRLAELALIVDTGGVYRGPNK